MPPPVESLVYVARPTVRLNGVEDERLASLITHLVMSEQEGGLSALELRLANSASLHSGAAEYAFDAGGDLELGCELIVGAGDSSSPTEIFRGFITGLEGIFSDRGPPELIVLAEDALQKLRCRRRSRTYEDQTLADIARTLANEHALTPVIDGLDQNFGTQVQLNETDLGFLRRLLARVDADVQIVGTELHVTPRDQVRRGTVDLALGTELKSARVLADLAHQATAVTTKGWDVSGGEPLQAEAPADIPGPGRGLSGSDAFESAFSARTEHSCHLMNDKQAEAEAVAAAAGRRRARRFVRIQGVTTGTPELRVGTHATVSGLGTWFSNTYYVTAVRHRFDGEHGYRTEFEAECAFLGEA